MMDFKKINFGRADAHTEGELYPDLLKNGFFNISSVVDEALSGHKFLFLGYKGSGKSSLSEHLRLLSGEIVVDQQRLKDFPFKEFKKILDTEDKMIRYKKSWDWILCVKVFEILSSDASAIIKTTEDIEKVVEVFTQQGIFPIKTISSLVEKKVKESISLSVKCLKVSEEVDFKNIQIDIDQLTDYIKSLLCSFKEENDHVMIIDDLDDILTPNGEQLGIIAALINEVKELNRFFVQSNIPFKILVLCRTDMFERLPDPNKNKIKQDYSFTFTWYREGIDNPEGSDLINLINNRARLIYPELDNVFNTFFPSKYEKKATYKALLDFTRHTPRDFIQLVNHIQSQCSDKVSVVSKVEIEKGIKDYSTEYFRQEILDELSGYMPGILPSRVLNALSSIRRRDFSFKEFEDQCSHDTALKDFGLKNIMDLLYECSAVGHKYNYDGGKTADITHKITFKYRNPSSAFTSNDRIILHKGLWKALNVNY